MAVKKRNIVLMSKDTAGNQTIDMPVTRLGNIEDDAEIKTKPASGDYIPIMDMEDGGQMKKFPYTPSESSGSGDSGNTHSFYQTNVTLTGSSGTGGKTDTLKIGLNVIADISEITVNGAKKKTAAGRIKITSFEVGSGYSRVGDTMASSDAGSKAIANSVPVIWKNEMGENFAELYVCFTALTGGDKPFEITTSGFKAITALTTRSLSTIYNFNWPFYFVEGM